MSIFQTGKIIITGARYYHQIQEAYDYLNRVIKDHADEVLRGPTPAQVVSQEDSASANDGLDANTCANAGINTNEKTKKVRKTRVRKIALSP
jgi:TATA-box binding protein (TBP) (component of TFIID and TFIIIB)